MLISDDWHQNVYRVNNEPVDWEAWWELCDEIYNRDGFRCQSCFKKKSAVTKLSVHHIIPRAEGGKDDPDNLITLCRSCHDEIELLEEPLRTHVEIYGYKKEPEKTKERAMAAKTKELSDMLDRLDAERPEWHKFVYGGVKKG